MSKNCVLKWELTENSRRLFIISLFFRTRFICLVVRVRFMLQPNSLISCIIVIFGDTQLYFVNARDIVRGT